MMSNCCYFSVNWMIIISIIILWLSSNFFVNCVSINRKDFTIKDESSTSGISVNDSTINVKNVVNKVNLKSANISDSRLPPFPTHHGDYNFSDDEEEEDDTVTGYEEYPDQEGSGDSDGSGSSLDSIGSGSNFGQTSLDRNKLQIPVDVDNALNKDSNTGRGVNRSPSLPISPPKPSLPSSKSSSSSSSPSLSLTSYSSSFIWLTIGINFLLISSSSNC